MYALFAFVLDNMLAVDYINYINNALAKESNMFLIEKSKQSDYVVSTYQINYRNNFLPRGVFTITNKAKGDVRIQGYVEGDFIYGFVLQKYRRKTEVTKKRNKPAVCTSYYKRVKLRDSGWNVIVYKFSVAEVRYFKQHKHHFDIVLF